MSFFTFFHTASALRRLLTRLQALSSGHDLSSSSSASDSSFNSLVVPAVPVTPSRVPPQSSTLRPITPPQQHSSGNRVVFPPGNHRGDEDNEDEWLHPIVCRHHRRSWLRRDSPPVPTISPPATSTTSDVADPTDDDDEFYEQIQQALALSMADYEPDSIVEALPEHTATSSDDYDGEQECDRLVTIVTLYLHML